MNSISLANAEPLPRIEPNRAIFGGPICKACHEYISSDETSIDGYCPFCHTRLLEKIAVLRKKLDEHPELFAKEEYQVIDITPLL